MSHGEFDIIRQYFQCQSDLGDGVVMGIGDDCAILEVAEGYQLAVTTDSLVSGVHFFENVDPYRLGYKSLAVNLSDLAAMGAKAKWVSLAITLPEINEPWLAEFCRGFFTLADRYDIKLIGGDTTKGPLSITISAKGLVKKGKALTRKGAKKGDILCVSSTLGDGAIGLASKLEGLQLYNQQAFIDALELTEPRLALAAVLVEYASSCIDISDGLSQDLSHILKQSQVCADIALEDIPLSDAINDEIKLKNISQQQAWHFALTGGDDYELLFTVSEDKMSLLKEQLSGLGITCFKIGKITDAICNEGFLSVTHQNETVSFESVGWDHFK